MIKSSQRSPALLSLWKMSCQLPTLIWPNGVPTSYGKTGRRNATKPGNSLLYPLQACSAQPRPGDEYRPRGVSGPVLRPLGLIPHRRREGVWRELSLMLSSLSNNYEEDELSILEGVEEERSAHELEELPPKASQECEAVVATRNLGRQELCRKPRMLDGRRETNDITFRRQEVHDVDLDYIDVFANCSLQKHPSLMNQPATAVVNPVIPVPSTKPEIVSRSQRQNMARFGHAHTKPFQEKNKRYILKQKRCKYRFNTRIYVYLPKSYFVKINFRSPWKYPMVDREYEYLSFILPAHLSARLRHTDLRDAQDYEPCERCRLRGTRSVTA